MKNKKGISLIVLVITIIVMIILAAAVVIALNNTGIIEKAGYAVQLTDEKQVQDLASLAWAEAYLDEDRTDTMENVVKAELEKHGVTDTDWNITVTDTGVTVTRKGASTATLITFTIDGTSCQAEEGMTWVDWVASKYNTVGMVIAEATGIFGDMTIVCNTNKDSLLLRVESPNDTYVNAINDILSDRDYIISALSNHTGPFGVTLK